MRHSAAVALRRCGYVGVPRRPSSTPRRRLAPEQKYGNTGDSYFCECDSEEHGCAEACRRRAENNEDACKT